MARRDITRPGLFGASLFGNLRQCSEKKLLRLERKFKETSIGSAALLNHSCEQVNAEWRFDERGDGDASFQVELLRPVMAGEEITVHYGDMYWEWVEEHLGIECQCDKCCG